MTTSSSQSNTVSNSSTSPGAQAQPEVQGLINGVQGLIPNSGVNGTESGAINNLTAMGANGNPYAAGTQSAIDSMLHGGGATSEVPAVQANLDDYKKAMAPYLSTDYSTINSPAVQAALQTIQNDVSSNVNGTFAAGGRTGSGMNTQTLARGIAQGEAPVILNQANTDTANRIGAANSVYGAGNTTAGTIAGMNEIGVNNENAGINNVGTALNNSTWGPQTEITAQELGQSLPTSNLASLANIGIPLAQLYNTTTGNSTTNGSNTMSGIQAFDGIMSGIGAGPGANAYGAKTAGSGLLGLLGMI